jgi:hypothetical protein
MMHNRLGEIMLNASILGIPAGHTSATAVSHSLELTTFLMH